jgi:hypothetical protein
MNDGSSDRTWAIMAELVRRDPNVIAVNLSRRHGHQLAITAGAGASAFSLSIPICKIRRNCSVRCGG